MIIDITSANFENEVVKSNVPVLVDFWAEWCGPCRAISPIVEELAEEYAGKVNIGKCDIEENDDIVMKYAVRNVPTIVFVKDGQLVDRQVGSCKKADLEAKIAKLL